MRCVSRQSAQELESGEAPLGEGGVLGTAKHGGGAESGHEPIFGHWVAELAQIAAHAETLHSMLEKRFNDAVLSDLTVFRRGLSLVATT